MFSECSMTAARYFRHSCIKAQVGDSVYTSFINISTVCQMNWEYKISLLSN